MNITSYQEGGTSPMARCERSDTREVGQVCGDDLRAVAGRHGGDGDIHIIDHAAVSLELRLYRAEVNRGVIGPLQYTNRFRNAPQLAFQKSSFPCPDFKALDPVLNLRYYRWNEGYFTGRSRPKKGFDFRVAAHRCRARGGIEHENGRSRTAPRFFREPVTTSSSSRVASTSITRSSWPSGSKKELGHSPMSRMISASSDASTTRLRLVPRLRAIASIRSSISSGMCTVVDPINRIYSIYSYKSNRLYLRKDTDMVWR